MADGGVGERVARLGKLLLEKEWQIAVAESCTGGMLAAAIVADTEASATLERGFVVYSVDSKCELLELERDRVEECAGVAEDIARAMARAALAKSDAKLSAAITGFAGPRESDEEVGLIHLATATADGTRHRALHLGDIGRAAANEEAVKTVLEMLIEHAQAD
jgi:nicotinamide-nucleotide amidase